MHLWPRLGPSPRPGSSEREPLRLLLRRLPGVPSPPRAGRAPRRERRKRDPPDGAGPGADRAGGGRAPLHAPLRAGDVPLLHRVLPHPDGQHHLAALGLRGAPPARGGSRRRARRKGRRAPRDHLPGERRVRDRHASERCTPEGAGRVRRAHRAASPALDPSRSCAAVAVFRCRDRGPARHPRGAQRGRARGARGSGARRVLGVRMAARGEGVARLTRGNE